MDKVFNRWERTRHQDAIPQVWLHQVADLLAERRLHLTRAGRQEDSFVGDMARFEGPGKEMAGEEEQVRLNRKY